MRWTDADLYHNCKCNLEAQTHYRIQKDTENDFKKKLIGVFLGGFSRKTSSRLLPVNGVFTRKKEEKERTYSRKLCNGEFATVTMPGV